MNRDLISRSVLLKAWREIRGVRVPDLVVDCMIGEAPAVDAEVVRHGRWIMRGGYIRCSECDAKTLWKDAGGTGGFSHEYEQVRSVHCHNCGAKMRGNVDASEEIWRLCRLQGS